MFGGLFFSRTRSRGRSRSQPVEGGAGGRRERGERSSCLCLAALSRPILARGWNGIGGSGRPRVCGRGVPPTRGVRWEWPSVSFLFFSPRRSRAPRQVTHSVTLSVGLNSGVPFVSLVSRLLASGETGPPGHGGGGGSVSVASAGGPGDPCPSCGREARAGRSGSRSLPRRHVSGVPVGNGESQARGEPEFPSAPLHLSWGFIGFAACG